MSCCAPCASPSAKAMRARFLPVAASPDGKWIAAGGWTTGEEDAIYIFEGATGRLATRLGPLGNVVYHLTFSPDGSRLAAELWGGEGMRLWETAGWGVLTEDKDYGGKDSYGAAFDDANRLYVVAYDGQIRRYSADGCLEAKSPTQGGKEPYSVALHPNSVKLAICFSDTTAVEVYDLRTLKRLYAAYTSGISGMFGSVAWSADGTRLYAAGQPPLIVWQDEGRGKPMQSRVSHNSITHLLPCCDGVAAGAADPAFGLIASDGAKRIWQEGVTVDMRAKRGGAFKLSANGKCLRFGLSYGGEQLYLFDLSAFQVPDAAQAAADLAEPKISGITVTDWEDNNFPKLNGERIALEKYETSRALAIAPDASCFVLGTEHLLRAYGADGGELWKKAIPGIAFGVNISGNGKLVAAAYSDGTIRWHRLSDGEELLALFVHAKDRRYIAWTPKGYYAASPGAEDLIGWHVNRGFDTAPDFYPASTFASTFNRPGIVKAALDI